MLHVLWVLLVKFWKFITAYSIPSAFIPPPGYKPAAPPAPPRKK